MKSKHSRLALAGVLALATSVTVGLVSGSAAEAKKKTTKSKTAVVSKTVASLSAGISEAEGIRKCPCCSKNDRYVSRISFEFMAERPLVDGVPPRR